MIRSQHVIFSLLGLLALSPQRVHAAESPSPADLDFFEKKVRPIFVERCYECHSAQAKKIRGHLLLDSRDGWMKGGDSGSPIIPGQPAKSALIKAIQYTDPDTEMPPKGKIPDGEIQILVEWVKRGAPDPRTTTTVAVKKTIDIEAGRRHWAYQPLSHPAAPPVKDAAWPRGEIDRFILARLERDGLHPVADADPTALVRRLYFDLIGLPPTPEQIDAFVKNPSPQRDAQLVDELLASPRFGERWGRHWLDVARFGESLTLRGFVLPEAWRYRDYVIESFNANRPFDRFIREQVSGDLMKPESVDERRRMVTATAFLAIANTNLEEQDKKQLEMDVVDEQIDTIGRAFLAQTIGCARCHDHKFDPIPTKDYYGLAGILHSTTTLEHSNVSKWIDMPLPTPPEREETLKKHEATVAALQAQIKQLKGASAKAVKGKKPAANTPIDALAGIVVDDAKAKRIGTWKESTSVSGYIGDGYLTDDGDRVEEKSLTFLFDVAETAKYEVRFAYTPSQNRATNVSVTIFSADGEKVVTVNEKESPPIDGHFVSLGQFNFEKMGQSFVIVSTQGADGHVIADAVQFVTPETGPVARETKPSSTDAATAVPANLAPTNLPPIKPGQSIKDLEAQLKDLIATGPKRDAVISIKESKEIGDTRIHIRGNVHTLGDPAPRGFLQVIPVSNPPAMPAKESGRRELGEWLTRADNPLPPRVLANRVWHWLFGVGIVRTPDNFGTTGETPSHPELLDYLATRFVAEGWSVKKLIREIVLSRAYQLASVATAESVRIDPENRLLSHANRRRLDAECIRDAMLSISGKLSLQAGGPTFKPGLSSDFAYKSNDTRRSVYVPAFRNALPEIFEVFDFADPSVSTGRRNVSTVAPQALFMLNHPGVIEQSRFAADRLLAQADCPDDRARIERAYRWTLGRAPTEAEQRIALNFLAQLPTSNQQPATSNSAAWTDLFHALFASMDFRYVD